MSLEYVIYTDESEKKGKFYSNFYGGLIVCSPDPQPVIDRLEDCKARLNVHREVKWQKVTENYLAKYVALIDAFFDEVAAGRIRVRVMFTQNQFIPTGRSGEQRRAEYHFRNAGFRLRALPIFSEVGGCHVLLFHTDLLAAATMAYSSPRLFWREDRDIH